eukprot:8662278-Pyramimonas_sp.AAC.1
MPTFPTQEAVAIHSHQSSTPGGPDPWAASAAGLGAPPARAPPRSAAGPAQVPPAQAHGAA